MMTTVSDENVINECQLKLGNILKVQLPKQGTYPIGSQGRTEVFNLVHNDKIWWCYDIWKKGSEPIHTNRFGALPLSRNTTNPIDLLINIPLRGVNRRFNGVFAKDLERYEYLVLHRGGFSRRPKDSFIIW